MSSGKIKLMVCALLAGLVISLAPAQGEQAPAKIKILTFNVWGIVGADSPHARAAAIGHQIAKLDPDVVALEEAWNAYDRQILLNNLRLAGYPVKDWRYVRNLYGAGLLFISKYRIESLEFEPYRVKGAFEDVEWAGGKGISYLRLRTPWGPLEFFHTHVVARMTDVFDDQGNYLPGDPLEVDRLLQVYQINRFVRAHRLEWNRSLIMAGDFNISPEMREYKFLLNLVGFENAFETVNPGQNPSTYSTQDMFVTQECSRIDHVLFKNFHGGAGFGLKPVSSQVVMKDMFTDPEDLKDINYSDHYAMLTEFEVIPDKDADKLSPPGVSRLAVPCETCPLTGYTDGVLELTDSNLPAWQDLALQFYAQAYDKHDRENQTLIPLADIISATSAITIRFPQDARGPIEERLGLIPKPVAKK
jgi:endonuclease/exonuclease/phosphatase family metal-dependent hydrolase